MIAISGTVVDLPKVSARISAPNAVVGKIGAQVITDISGVDKYTGPYEVTPKVEGQRLATAQKYMNQDVNVKAIPFYETSNPSGGTTVYIASSVSVE